jgi:hypothetical protein
MKWVAYENGLLPRSLSLVLSSRMMPNSVPELMVTNMIGW